MKRVLIIDDEPDIREITKISLELTKQWDVLTAGSSQDGIAIAISHQPDAILLDVMMPDADGLATLEHLKTNATTQLIPVIMLTATANLTTHRQYAELGAKAIVLKPFDPGTLGDQIATALGWSQDT